MADPLLPPRKVADSRSEMTELVLPNDTNTLGNLLGGRLMHYIDLVAAIAAYRHARTHVVTASMDHIDFIAPVHVGDLLILKSSLNRAFRTSMEVGVKVWVEHTIDGTLRHVASAYLTFVAVDRDKGKVGRRNMTQGTFDGMFHPHFDAHFHRGAEGAIEVDFKTTRSPT